MKGFWHTKVGSFALELIKARKLAVLLSFHAAGISRGGGSTVAAAHYAMQTMPSDIVQEIICAGGLQLVE